MIGIFDSGSGGLTVLRAIREELPSADVVYFGDIANAPYGERTRESLSILTANGIKLLVDNGAQKIVSACNSVSASLAVSLIDILDIPLHNLIEMVGPTVSAFRGNSSKILICATPATVQSGIYQNAFRMINKTVTMLAMENLAYLIENGTDSNKIKAYIENKFSKVDIREFNEVLLCCTHYPLVSNIFQEVLGEGEPKLFDPASEVALRVNKLWWPQEVHNGKTCFLISKDSDVFRKHVTNVMGDNHYSIDVI